MSSNSSNGESRDRARTEDAEVSEVTRLRIDNEGLLDTNAELVAHIAKMREAAAEHVRIIKRLQNDLVELPTLKAYLVDVRKAFDACMQVARDAIALCDLARPATPEQADLLRLLRTSAANTLNELRRIGVR